MEIKNITAREILDSKGHPTVEAEVILENGIKALGQVPSGASTGSNEAIELRDGNPARYQGKGVLKAVANVKGPIRDLLVGQDAYDQEKIDQLLIEADGTENKSKLGANAIVGVSMAVCRAAARSQKIPLYKYFGQLSGNQEFILPQALILLLEGGRHGGWSTDVQEYFVIPKKEKFGSFTEKLRVGTEIFHVLEKILAEKDYGTGVGFEGAFCPNQIQSNEEAFGLMIEATQKAGYSLPDEVVLGFDAAASEFFRVAHDHLSESSPRDTERQGFHKVTGPIANISSRDHFATSKEGRYVLKSEGGKELTSRKWSQKIIEWTKKYPIWLIEDAHGEDDWNEWVWFTSQVGDRLQIVGDDLLTTNVKRIKRAIDKKAVNSVLIKLNQIGTVTETLEAIKLADSAGLATIISHRGGETNDDFIADLVVGTTSWQCKFGGPDRGERLAKYNRLLRIEEELKL